MAALRKPDRNGTPLTFRPAAASSMHSEKIHAFAQRAYEKTGGPTPDLRRVYAAYLANQKKLQNKA